MPLQVLGTLLSGLLADFRQAVDVNPALSDCYYNLGNAEFELGHHEESILVVSPGCSLLRTAGRVRWMDVQMFTRAIAIDLEFAAAYNNRATVFKLVDQHEKVAHRQWPYVCRARITWQAIDRTLT